MHATTAAVRIFAAIVLRVLPLIAIFAAAPVLARGTAPEADAGRDLTTALDDVVVLDGSRSTDADGDLLTYSWTLTSAPAGSLAVLSDAATVRPSFQVDVAGDYVAELVVTDARGKSASDTVIVSTGNVAPVADAGADQTVALGETVQLDASASTDFNGDRLGFAWSLVSVPVGSLAALSDPAALQPTFVADLAGDYVVSLTASDATLSSDPDEVTISTVNSRPVGAAGPDQKVDPGQTVLVRLEGLTDVDGDLLEERDWTFLSRPPGSTADFLPNKNRRFIIDLPGTYVVQRMVSDGLLEGEPETLILTTNANLRPVADAGPDQTVDAGVAVRLRGAGSSDVDGDRLTYRWALTTLPMGSTAALDDPAAVNPAFEADLPGTYVAQLIVNDGTESSRPDTVVVSTAGSPPVADAGPDQQMPKFSDITLDGSGSNDADGDTLAYRWSLSKRPSASSATLTNPDTVNPTFYTDTGRRFIAQLIVNDGQRDSAPDTVVIGPGNMRPVAEAGADQTVQPGDPVTLDGGGSFDAAGDPLTYRWALLGAPAESTASLIGANTATPSFTADRAGVYVAQLIVTDDDVAPLESNPDTVVIVANIRPVADAGPDQDGYVDQAVALDGTGSFDADGDPITYAWSFVSQPSGSLATLTGATTATPPTSTPSRPATSTMTASATSWSTTRCRTWCASISAPAAGSMPRRSI